MEEQEIKSFYEQARDWYQKALEQTDFFEQRKYLGNSIQFLVRAHHKGEVDTLEGLPENGVNVLGFDKKETSELIKTLYDLFPSENDESFLKQEDLPDPH